MSLADQRLVARFRGTAVSVAQSLIRRHDADADAHTDTIAAAIAAAVPAQDDWHTVGDTGEPALLNGWTVPDPTNSPLQFRKDSAGNVHIRGVLSLAAAVDGHVFTLPVGYRPVGGSVAQMQTTSDTSFRQADVNTAGEVRNSSKSGAATLTQNCIIFSTHGG